MHELGIATGVIENVCSTAKKNNVKAVKQIDLVVGSSSAIIEEALIEAVKALQLLEQNKICKDAKIDVETIESKSICINCGEEFTHGIGAAQCPNCKSTNTQIISGTDIYIKQIMVDV